MTKVENLRIGIYVQNLRQILLDHHKFKEDFNVKL